MFDSTNDSNMDTEVPNGTVPLVNIGEGSLLWKYAGDLRIFFTLPSTELLQMMHPAIAAGVRDHSRFMKTARGRLERLMRSGGPILGTIYDQYPEETGMWIRNQHLAIRGTYASEDAHIHHYHALDPETYWWAHATFQEIMVGDLIARFDRRGLSLTDREQLTKEGATWYSRYGVTSRPVPGNYASFKQKWDDVCSTILVMTPQAEKMIAMVNKVGLRLLTIGGLPESVRSRFDIPWSPYDQECLGRIESRVKRCWPKNGLYTRGARRAMRRVRKTI